MKIKHLILPGVVLILGATIAKAVFAIEITEEQQQVICQLKKGAEEAQKLGYKLVYWPIVNRAMSAARAPIRLKLHPDVEYVFIGYCDKNCTDADLFLMNEAGETVTSDQETDDYPTISYKAPAEGVYEISLKVANCSSADGCVYGLGIMTPNNTELPNTSQLPEELAQFRVCE